METRTFEVEALEIREIGDGQAPTITGYAVVFDSWSEVMVDGRGRPFRERFAPTAFDRALAAGPDIRALWNHNSDFPLGRTRNGTLRVDKDARGVRFELTPPATSWGADAVASIRRGDVSGMSFGFAAKRENGDTWTKGGADGIAERTVLDAHLVELSPVTFPAYPATDVAVRSVEVPEFPNEESDSRAADENDTAQVDSRAADTAGAYQHLIDILRRR